MTMVRMSSRIIVVLLLLCFAIPIYLLVNYSDHSYSTYFGNAGAYETSDLSYGIILDAGSTGTRLFLYQWRSTSDMELIDIDPALDHKNEPVVKKVHPGLSTFADHPQDAAEYIKPLLDFAVEFVPEEKRPYTPVFIFATAGMRLVPQEQREAVLTDLHTKLPQMTPMQIMKEHIRVIEGKWEGIYSWVAVNYILGRFKPLPSALNTLDDASSAITTSSPARPKTVGMIDMGGASVQIAFEMPSNETFRSENVENVNLGCRDESDLYKYKLYVTTFLGYGVNEGLRKYEQKLAADLETTNGSYARDECMPRNLQKVATRDDGTQFVRKGIGDWETCVNKLSHLVAAEEQPSCQPECFFGSVPAPKLPLSEMSFYGFSECWFSVEDVLALGGRYNYSRIHEKSKSYCSQRWSEIQGQARRRLYPKANEERLRTQCFKSAWVSAVLHAGFEIDKERNNFQSAFTIEGQEVQWALGAMIYHMRYFPLRDSPTRISSKTIPEHSHPLLGFNAAEALFIIACVAAVIYFFFVWNHNTRPGMRREPSLWGYMMLQHDDYYPTYNFKNVPTYA